MGWKGVARPVACQLELYPMVRQPCHRYIQVRKPGGHLIQGGGRRSVGLRRPIANLVATRYLARQRLDLALGSNILSGVELPFDLGAGRQGIGALPHPPGGALCA